MQWVWTEGGCGCGVRVGLQRDLSSNPVIDPEIKKQILDDLEALSPELQREAARSVRAVRYGNALPPPTRGEDLLHLAGILDNESAREVMAAIEGGCKQVDPRVWEGTDAPPTGKAEGKAEKDPLRER